MKLKKIIILIVIIINFYPILTSISISKNTDTKQSNDVFYDDFSSGILDTNKWLIAQKAWGGNNGGVVKDNISLSNGILQLEGHGDRYTGNIEGIKRPDGTRTGAAIATKDYFGSGSYEVVAKVPQNLGSCSAIWTFEYEEYYPGDEKFEELSPNGGSYYVVNHEIDIEMPGRPAKKVENVSYEYALCNTWVGEKGNEYTTGYTKLPFAQNDGNFHTYRFDWHTGDENEIPRVEFYIDNQLVNTNTTHIPTNKGRLWIGIWFPNGWAGTPDFDTQTFEIDSVKITPFHEAGDTEQHETYGNDGWYKGTDVIKDENIQNDNLLKGDIDLDGKITVNDLAKLKLHLIEKEALTSVQSLKLADIDLDEKITINDLAKLKLIIIGKEDKITVEDTSFSEFKFSQITPVDEKVTFERVIMTSKIMDQYGATGAGSQWPTSLESSKDGKLMLTGNDVAGMAKSKDHGQTWYPCNSGFETRGVGMFAIDPYNNNHVLALGISKWLQNGGIYYSNDEATTWEKGFKFACSGIRYHWDGLEFDPTTFDEEKGYTTDVYFSTPYRRDTTIRKSSKEEPETYNSQLPDDEVGLYKSTDGGKTFEIIINDKRVADGIIKITDDGRLFIGNQYGLFEIDKINNTIVRSYLENDPIADYTKGITGLDVVHNVIYAQTWDGIYTLTSDGTLTKITVDETYKKDNWPQFLSVAESNPNHMIYMYRDNIDNYYSIETHASKDGGKTWTNSRYIVNSTFYKLDGRGKEKRFMIDPTDENNIVTFGGFNLVRSSDGGDTFIQIAGLSNTMQGGRFNFNYYNPDLLMFSAQDYTGVITKDGGKYYEPLFIQGKGNIYGGFAADENTYFGFANETWWSGTLTVTHDGGKSWTDFGLKAKGVPGTVYYSSMQSYTDPNVLFAAQYYSKDKGYTWQEMNGCVAVMTINYTGQHELYGGDEDGNLVVSYDNGDTWTKLNSKPFYTANNIVDLDIIDIAYDHVHNYAYVLVNGKKDNDGNVQRLYRYDITNDISTKIDYPTDGYRGWGLTKSIAIDPNAVDVLYIGQAGDYFCSSTGLIRSIDGGKTWRILTTANDSHYESYATNQGGYEVNTIRVNPNDGKLWISMGCYGYETINPPYDASQLNHKAKIEHTIKYVYDDKVIKEVTINNGKSHDFVYEVDGLKFIDWYTDESFEHSFSNGEIVYNSMVLYAKMEPSKKLELYVSDEIYKSIDLDKFSEASEEFIPQKDGYAFYGWYADKELTNIADFEKINSDTKLYAGWYKVVSQIYDPTEKDVANYIAFSDHKVQNMKMAENDDYVPNRCVQLSVDKNSTYLVTLKMDTRFRIGLAKSKFWAYGTVSEYYINEHDTNDAIPLNKYVYKTIDTTNYAKMLIFYYTNTGSRDYMDIRNTLKVYKLENNDLIYNLN